VCGSAPGILVQVVDPGPVARWSIPHVVAYNCVVLHVRIPRRGVHRCPGALPALLGGAGGDASLVRRFERAAAHAFGVGHAVATGSGRAALTLLSRALDLQPGDEVLVPALTFGAVPDAVERLGLVPVYVDVEASTAQMDPEDLRARIGPRSRVVVATHLFGDVCKAEHVERICSDAGLVMLVDFAQAAGARLHGRPVGAWGRAGFTSLETVKTLPAFGGGLVTTSDGDLARRVDALASRMPAPEVRRLAAKVALGQVESLLARPVPFSVLGWPLMTLAGGERTVRWYKGRKSGAGNHHARLHPAQAAVALNNLEHLQAHVEERRRTADRLWSLLGTGCWRPAREPGSEPACYQLVVRARDPRGCALNCRRAGVDVGVHVVEDLSGGACPTAATLAEQLVQLPCHPGLDDEHLRRVAEAVGPWLA
jgi:dTDP-4-amino-4,6-dideoxygalactose transaminase